MQLYGKTAAHAIAVMSYLAADRDRRAGAEAVANARGLSRPLAAKLLTRLATAGLVSGQPGPGGGYTLARPPAEVRLSDISDLFEQHEPKVLCPFGFSCCEKDRPCALHDQIAALRQSGRRFLENTLLSAFAEETLECGGK